MGLGVLALLGALVLADQLRGGRGIFRTDILTQFLPWYTYLGERLRAGDIPGWLPFSFAGTPFAGDPQSGWSYLPAMAIFTLWGGVTGFKILFGFHVALAAFSAYALARVNGMGAAGAVVAGCRYSFGGFLERTRCCTIHAELAVWLPAAFLGIELAARAQRPSRAVAWLALTAFCFSQMIGGWPGKGAYYGGLAIGAYLLFRAVVAPPGAASLRRRTVRLLAAGAAVAATGAGLAAYGLLPRVQAVAQTHLAGGYDDATRVWRPWELIDRLFSNDDRFGRWYVGAALLTTALAAPWVARRRAEVRFWLVYGAVALLAVFATLPIWWPFYRVLPRFEGFHRHFPDQVLTVFYLAPAMLAGYAVDAIWRERGRVSPLLPAGAGVLAVAVGTLQWHEDGAVSWVPSALGIAAVASLLLLVALRPGAHRLAAAALVVAIVLDPAGATAIRRLAGDPKDGVLDAAVANYRATDGAAAFLRERVAIEPPFRFFGHDPGLLLSADFDLRTYIVPGVTDPAPPRLLVNNRAVLLGLEDVQGYNPLQSESYVALVETANDAAQSYHTANVLTWGWSSGLWDLLGVRYVVVPRDVPPGRPDLLHLSLSHPTVYADDQVRVVRNDAALPRAWLVHDVREVSPNRALRLFDARRRDPRAVAFVPPGTSRPPVDRETATAGESVTVVRSEGDRVELAVVASGRGLVVLAVPWDPGWHATVDGQRVEPLPVDGIVQGIPVTAGSHAVTLSYDPPGLQLGLLVSAMTLIAIVVAIAGLSIAERRRSETWSPLTPSPA